MGREKKLSFRATGWHVDRLTELQAKGVAEGQPPRSMGTVIREAIALLWEQHCKDASSEQSD